MKIENNLDWMHLVLGKLRWTCTKKTAPRTWELCLMFRFVPVRGETCIDAIAIEASEEDFPSPDFLSRRHRSRYIRGEFRKCRDFLHTVILEAASTGTLKGRRFRSLAPPVPIPAMDTREMDKREFLDRFELFDPTEDRPDSWVLRDRDTEVMVEFKLAPDAGLNDRRKAVQDAMHRIDAVNRRTAAVRRHVSQASTPTRPN